MSENNLESDRIGDFEIENPEEWARQSAGTASHCPYCGYSVVEHIEDSDRHYCPECETEYTVVDHRRDDNS
jgi:uncharacterized Zn finger protein (UPF0148 family)